MGQSIKQLINRCVDTETTGLAVGVVLAAEPLEIVLKDDAKIRYSAVSLAIPPRLLPLAAGEELYMLSLHNGKLCYILDRA